MTAKSYVIALEEHYHDAEVKQHAGDNIAERLDDVGALRLKEMDEAGIDLQVLSHSNPGPAGGRRRDRRAVGAPRQRPARRDGARPSRPLRRVRRPAYRRPQGRRRRAGAHASPSSASRAR